ncbi:MAG TPA: AsmA-like C-terminal domain-containing protein [Candidatus Binataceae bacterium]|nr:AsmA-like C-terminal domain-containing protein [Candidatus Binataceae bacterium]
MKKLLTIVAAIVGLGFIAIVAIVVYAYFNLNSIIAANRSYILARASDALGRPVQAQDIKATIGWGVEMDVTGVQVADDPSFSQLAFLQASDVNVSVELLPLLSRSLKVTSLLVKRPQLRVIRDRTGRLNLTTLGTRSGTPAGPKPGRGGAGGSSAGGLAALTVRSLKIEDGSLSYQDQRSGGPPLQISHFALAINNFSATAPFDLAVSMAALGTTTDFSVSGKVGPLMENGAIDPNAVPLDLNASAGPLALGQLTALPELADRIPSELSISRPLIIDARVGGTVGAPKIDTGVDLSTAHVVYPGIFDKQEGVPFKFSGSATRAGDAIRISDADLTLAALKAKIRDVNLNKSNLAAHVDTNSFDLASVAKTLTAAGKYNPTGHAEIHANVSIVNHQPSLTGDMMLTDVNAAMPGNVSTMASGCSGPIRMTGNSAKVGPLSFNLGSQPARIAAEVQSLRPLRGSYELNAALVKIGELVPSRASLGEQVSQLVLKGTVNRAENGEIAGAANLSSASGTVANVPYSNLTLAVLLNQRRVTIESLDLGAFDGKVGASGVASLAADRSFNLKFNASNIDVQKALAAEKAKAANTLRGILTGSVQVAGAGTSLDRIKPTLRGQGGGRLVNGKLVGVNVVAEALKKVNNLPAIGALVPSGVVARHPELFRSNDTDIERASLTFTLQGPRLTTHDLNIAAADYSVLGDGWFDMDKNLDVAARILMSKAFSSELVAAKRNISYLTNSDGRVEIPLRVAGQLPKPAIVPDVGPLVQRAAGHALENKLGSFLGGGKGGGSGNPLKDLRGLFH